MKRRLTRMAGFTLLPVILTMTLIAAIAFLLNRDNGMNTEMIASQSDADRARYAAEAGLQAVNANVQNNNCSGLYYNALAPLTNSNFGGASFKAYANPGFGWPVTLVSTGTYNGTSVKLTRNNVIVYNTSPDNYTLQPGPATSYDTYVNPALPSLNFGAATTLQVGSGVGESLLKFDFSILPAGSKIVQYYSGGTLQPGATLSLYQSNKPGSGSAVISAHLITRSWTQGTGISPANGATWNTYDGINAWSSPGIGYNPTPLATIPYANVITWNNWDISDAVIAWMGNVYPNYGIWIKNFSGLWQNVTYSSSDNSNGSQRPKITINYLRPCGTTGPATCTAGNIRDDFAAIAYTGNNGSVNWSNNWTETGESDGPTIGKLSVLSATQCASGNCLKLRNDTATVMRITRQADLSSAVSATLKFDYRRTMVSGSGGNIKLEISKDGGTNFSLLKTYPLTVTDGAQIAESIDISSYLATNTQIRFSTDGSNTQTNIHIDNVEIITACTAGTGTTVTLTAVADAHIDENSGSTQGTGLSMAPRLSNQNNQGQALVRFDTSSIPVGSTVTSAKLRLYLWGGIGSGNLDFGVYRITQSWTETTMAWGLGYEASVQQALLNINVGVSGVWQEWTIPPALVQEWVDGISPNYGMLVRYEGSQKNRGATFDTREETTNTHPTLVVTYQ